MCSELGKECIPVEEDENSVWAESIPQHVMESILARLPVECVLRFPIVCRDWNIFFSSQNFLTLWSQTPKRDQWLVLCGNSYCLAYSFSTSKWLTTSLSAFPVCGYKGSELGLFLLQKCTPLGWRFFVFNPVTQTSFQLPPVSPILLKTFAAHIRKGAQGDDYKVVVVGSNWRGANIVQIYDSCEKSWEIAGQINLLKVPNEIAFCNSWFFFTSLEPIVGVGIRVCRYDYTVSTFIPMPASYDLSVPKLVVCGKLFLIVVPILKITDIMDIIVWQLESQENFKDPFWKEITRMPQLILEKFDSKSKWDLSDCIGFEDCLCFRIWGGIDVVEYNLIEGSWKHLSKCPTTDRDEIMCSFSFQPNPLIKL
ncbi:hypothetical protein SUGI_1082160 [Cryptomeria japonica]|uniref:F-box only protein 6-like n=1 Tax=Cryptomeria japonica TaxID=3369 RepID=UPI002414CBEC|nr:F-box only protein 6-like [Cryptomeria japonica]GLJ50810.1 hypothetical protein SUGI_1082160 [Cryptomeria japonica]